VSPTSRGSLRLEAFIGALLEYVPLPTLGQLALNVSTDDEAELASRLAGDTWHHDGVRAFVRELAERLQPERAPPTEPQSQGAPTPDYASDLPPEGVVVPSTRQRALGNAKPEKEGETNDSSTG
jgi:hypothetical protein